MTQRLYYADPYCREFDARVERVDERDGRTFVVLDRTAFYPTSGGQPFDTGLLGPHRVVEVLDEDDGTIAHVIQTSARVVAQDFSPANSPDARVAQDFSPPNRIAVGDTVHGTIDWTRRFDHMQQHTGQHILSAAFDRLFGVRTVSFHLGTAVSTIDLARELSPGDLAAAEAEANRIVWEDRPVTIRFTSADEAARLPLRKEPVREGTLRLIDVDGFDLSACGGTHVARTGAIGVIAIGSWERFKAGQRVEFFCGRRALERFRLMRDILGASVRLLSVVPEEVPGAIERLQMDARDDQRATAALHRELARYRADELAGASETTAAGQLVLRAVDADANGLKTLAAAMVARPRHIVALVSTSRPAVVVVARSHDVSLAANRVIAALAARFGGRGGGKAELAQAGGLDASVDAVLELARATILSSLE